MNYKLALLCVIVSFQLFGQKSVINSGWQFTLDTNKDQWQTVNIPHTWNTDDAFDDQKGYYRGEGWYQKQIFIPSENKELVYYLNFKGVNQEAEVFFNGTLLGSHKGLYSV